MTDEATAFVPGHVTGFFSAHPHDDPYQAGSRGAGVTLAAGVEVTVRPTAGTSRVVELDGTAVEMPPVDRVLDALGVDADVHAETPLPLGAGFGVSGAMSLGAALAANTVFDCARSENELTALAHAAEVQSGTGLGDVVAQARGGMPVRLEPGAPDYGRLDAIPARPDIEYVTFGELSTEEVLSGDTDRLSAAGGDALALLAEEPTVSQFMYASRRFAREAGLLTPEVTDAIRAVSEAGGEASMAMLGHTVFALDSGLSDAGYDAESCRTHPAGATLR